MLQHKNQKFEQNLCNGLCLMLACRIHIAVCISAVWLTSTKLPKCECVNITSRNLLASECQEVKYTTCEVFM